MIALTLIRFIPPPPLMVILESLFFRGLMLSIVAYNLYKIWSRRKRNKNLLSYMSQSTEASKRIHIWLKDHEEELTKDSIGTLNHPNFLNLIKEAQGVDDIIVELDPGYKDKFMPPTELHRHLLEMAKEKHKQTH